MKKAGGLILAGLVLSMFMINFASAGVIGDRMNRAVEQVTDFIKPIIIPLLGNTGGVGNFSDSEVLFAKFLFFILIMLVVKTALDRVDTFASKQGIKWIISIIIPLVGVRYLDSQTILAMSLPSSALALAVTAGLPFVLYFFIVEPISSTTVRKVLWILFGVAFLGLFFARNVDLTGLAFWIYPITAALALIMMLFDGTIQNYLRKAKLEKLGFENTREYEIDIRRKIDQAKKDVNSNIITRAEFNALIARYNETIKTLHHGSI